MEGSVSIQNLKGHVEVVKCRHAGKLGHTGEAAIVPYAAGTVTQSWSPCVGDSTHGSHSEMTRIARDHNARIPRLAPFEVPKERVASR